MEDERTMVRFSIAASALSLIALLGGFLALADEKEPAPKAGGDGSTFKPVAPLEVVMNNLDDIFSDMQKLVEKKSALEKRELKTLRKDALFLSELFNVVAYHKGEKDWREWSHKNLRQFQELAAQTEKEDQKVLKTTYDAINATCEACHDKYRDKEK
jgi:Skp family chaperone for outer membrane proteins